MLFGSMNQSLTSKMIIIMDSFSNIITRISNLPTPHKILFDTPHAHEPTQQIGGPSFIVRAARPRTSEWLLPHHCSRALAIDVEVPRAVAQPIFCETDRLTVPGEDGTRECVVGCRVDEFAHFFEGGFSFLGGVVDVDGEDGAEEFGAHEGMVRVRGEVDGRVDEVTG